MKKIKVLLADDHTILRKGLCSLLADDKDIEVVAEAENGREALDKVKKLKPDVVVMDIAMPGLNGLEATRQIKKYFPEIKVLILSMHANEEYIFQTLRAGASGYLIKKAAPMDLTLAIQAAIRGESFLSPAISRTVIKEYIRKAEKTAVEDEPFEMLTDREREVLQLIAEGHSNREIADRLYISTKTVETHRAHLMEKLNIHSAADLTKYAIRKGLTSLEP